jgi:hypothetical protein
MPMARKAAWDLAFPALSRPDSAEARGIATVARRWQEGRARVDEFHLFEEGALRDVDSRGGHHGCTI